MLTPRELAWLDQSDADTARIIREHGWMVEAVGTGQCDCCDAIGPADPAGDEYDDRPPPFAYSVGLFGMGHPELVVTGLPALLMMRMINTVGARVRDGLALVPGQQLELDEVAPGLRVVVEELPNPGEILFSANRFYKRPPEASVDAFVLTWCDTSGHFPWDSGCEVPSSLQPRPGEWSA